ncbi:MAG: GHKL domain-containing protein [Planctomycetes bacterium]|nr:GHKL domain-containing protein [Planctomycetota bacterium]
MLLAIAVILPTVCLLWFMTQAVKNERLAVRQKLIGIYKNRLETSAREKLSDDWISLNTSTPSTDGFLVFDSNNELSYPVVELDETVSSDDTFDLASKLEYRENDPNKAMAEYRRIAENADSNSLRISADISRARCLRKLNRIDEAISHLRAVISKYDDSDKYVRVHKCRARLLLLELCRQTNDDDFLKELSDTFDYAAAGMATDNDMVFLGRKSHTDKYIPSSLQIFMLNRFIDYAGDMKETASITKKIKRAHRLIEIADTSLMLSNRYTEPSFAVNKGIFRLDTTEQFYGKKARMGGDLHLMAFKQEDMVNWFAGYLEDIKQLPAACAIYDDKGRFIAGSQVAGRKPFIKAPLPSGYFPGWYVELYIDGTAFEKAARAQVTAYVFAAGLVIVLMLILTGFGGSLIARQARLNKLKNDFIATVTHELKTPLSSMRVLVDTLLEGNYSDQQQATEYLQLISKENLRLSRLIDNFLTFSRMERNKQAFDIVKTDPSEIAKAAADAVQTKFNRDNCQFSVKIDDNLPSAMADKDAIVTVLVNLLDNAYKYSHGDKRIELKVFSENNAVCFSVADNGIGMTGRQAKKIFDRFYQADSSLSRQAEGTGLGLSIVKFIVEAHKGRIDVESKPGKGSKFRLFLPVLRG